MAQSSVLMDKNGSNTIRENVWHGEMPSIKAHFANKLVTTSNPFALLDSVDEVTDIGDFGKVVEEDTSSFPGF